MRASTSGSTAEVASSRISSRGWRTSARASEIRWRWPPESEVPRSPSRVSRPSGRAATKPSAWAVRSAAQTSSSGTSAPRVTLPRTVSSKRNGGLRHERTRGPAGRGRGLAGRRRRRGSRPRSGSTSRVSRLVSVLLPEAVAPTTATVRPGSTSKSRRRAAAPGVVGGRRGPRPRAGHPRRCTRHRPAPYDISPVAASTLGPGGSPPRCAGTRRAASRSTGSGRRRW